MSEWRKARKKEIIEWREAEPTLQLYNEERWGEYVKDVLSTQGEIAPFEETWTTKDTELAIAGRDVIVKDKIGVWILTKEEFNEEYEVIKE